MQGTELPLDDFINHTFNIAWESVSFKFCMLLSTTKFYIFGARFNSFDLHWRSKSCNQKKKKKKKSEKLCNNSFVKWPEGALIFAMVYYAREITTKNSCTYGKYESFERFLFVHEISVIWKVIFKSPFIPVYSVIWLNSTRIVGHSPHEVRDRMIEE